MEASQQLHGQEGGRLRRSSEKVRRVRESMQGLWPESVVVPVGVMVGREMICEGLRMKSGFNLIQPG